VDEKTLQRALGRVAAHPEAIGRFRVLRVEEPDGIKFFLDAPRGGIEGEPPGADAWVLVRASGTEPLLRIYAEAASPETVHEMLDAAVALIEQA